MYSIALFPKHYAVFDLLTAHRALEDLTTGKGSPHLVRALFGENELHPPDPKFSTILSSPIDIEKVRALCICMCI